MRGFWHDLGSQERYFIAGTALILVGIILAFCLLEPPAQTMDRDTLEAIARQHAENGQ